VTASEGLFDGRGQRVVIGVEDEDSDIENVSTLDDAVAAFSPLCASPIPKASRLAPQAR
jgi:hypothetical protein